jgi:hypothetical protein
VSPRMQFTTLPSSQGKKADYIVTTMLTGLPAIGQRYALQKAREKVCCVGGRARW